MTCHNHDYVSYVNYILENDPEWRQLHPPATDAEMDEVTRRAIKELRQPLHPDYLQLVRLINGGGRDVCFFGTHTRPQKIFGREMIVLGIVEENLQLRKREFIDPHEVGYAGGETCVFLPGETPGTWIGRDEIRRDILFRFDSFYALVRYAYGFTGEEEYYAELRRRRAAEGGAEAGGAGGFIKGS